MNEKITQDHPRAKASIEVFKTIDKRLNELQDRIKETLDAMTRDTIKKEGDRSHVWTNAADTKAHWDALIDFIAFAETLEKYNKDCTPRLKQAEKMLEQLRKTIEDFMKSKETES